MYQWRVPFQMTCLLKNVTSEALLHLLSLFTNIIGWCSWWNYLSDQYFWHVNFVRCWYWGYLVFPPTRNCILKDYKIITSVFQNKSYSVFPWGYHMFQLKENIYNYCKSMRINHVQRNLWSSWLWWIYIWVIHTRISSIFSLN